MIRFGLGVLVATTACAAALGVAACGDTIQGGAPPGAGGGAGGGGGAANTGGGTSPGGTSSNGGSMGSDTPTACKGECCPATTTSCYSSTDPTKQWGAECQATRDNTDQDHIQMRQAWIRATTPVGNTSPIVYGVLAGRTELPAADCHQGGDATFGDGGYIQLIDFYLGGSRADPTHKDISKDYSTVGYARFLTKDTLADSLTNGFCVGTEQETNATDKFALTTAQVTPTDLAFPPGLQPPMGAKDGWNVTYTKAKRIPADFVVATDRVKMLGQLAKDGEFGKDGFTGVFYYDEATGRAHGYGSLGWTVVYTADHQTHLSIPIREVETKSIFNDPKHPDCVGAYRGDKVALADGCKSTDPKVPAWGCLNDSCPGGEGPAETDGYFLVSELDQIYTGDLASTLCVSYPGVDSAGAPAVQAQGFYNATDKSCRSAKWDATLAKGAGMPKGDWCAATNSAATADCHDAFHSHSFHVFVGGKIKVDPDATKPLPTCKFSP